MTNIAIGPLFNYSLAAVRCYIERKIFPQQRGGLPPKGNASDHQPKSGKEYRNPFPDNRGLRYPKR